MRLPIKLRVPSFCSRDLIFIPPCKYFLSVVELYGKEAIKLVEKTIIAKDVNFLRHTIECTYKEIDTCPRCHTSLFPETLDAYFVERTSFLLSKEYNLYLILFCPKCSRCFICEYTSNSESFQHCVPKTYPSTFSDKNFDDSIKNMSPKFIKIYNQSLAAETSDFDELCGIGYRKALEFLVKDYLCKKFPGEEESIKYEFLGPSIKRIDDHRIKTLAERSSWIGNDETHYEKRLDNATVSDMKIFIDAMVRFIESELAFEKALGIEFAKNK